MTRWLDVREELSARPRRWLVTGGAGFIGSHLVQWLLEHHQHVCVLDDFSTGTHANLATVRALVGADAWTRCEIATGDIRDPATCLSATEGRDFVLHQAALGSVPRSLERPADTHAVNVDGTVNVLLGARAAGVRTVVFASSSSVYGDDASLAKREDAIGRPLSPYATSKRIGELYADTFHRVYGLRTVGLRYFNVVGPRQSPTGPYAAVVPRWIAALASGRRPVVFGDGTTSRDFCPVANVVQANVLAALAGDDAMGGVFNVALGRTTTLLELFAMLRDALASRGAPCAALEPAHEGFRAGDVRHSLADVRRARELLGYAPEIDLAQGLALAVAHESPHPRGGER
jgi:UDP-N-acetylglucosamine/UDP-N-acetylgalactosamine 4-epimerase